MKTKKIQVLKTDNKFKKMSSFVYITEYVCISEIIFLIDVYKMNTVNCIPSNM